MTVVGNDEVLITCPTFFNPVGLRLYLLIVETSIAGDCHPGDIHQGNPAISARFLLRVIQANIAVDSIVLATRGINAVMGIVYAGIVSNDVVLIAAISQTADAVPTIAVKRALADNGVTDVHAEIESITPIISPDVVCPETVLNGRAGVEAVSQTTVGEAVADNRSNSSLNAYAVCEPMLHDAPLHAGICRPHQMYGRHGKVDKTL